MFLSDFSLVVSNIGSRIFSGYFGLNVSTLDGINQDKTCIDTEIAVVIQLLGEINGRIICAMTENTAKKIVGQMFGGLELETLGEMERSALLEFSNWFVSGIATEFSSKGLSVDITPPIIHEQGLPFLSDKENTYIVTLLIDYGIIDVHFSFDVYK